MIALSKDQIAAVLNSGDPELRRFVDRKLAHPYYSFEPRPNNAAAYDEQAGFVNSDAFITFGIGGNGSGKTFCSAQRLARFVLEKQPPPALDTPFWIIANSYEMVCESMWFQKLREIIPPECIDHDRITWYSATRKFPKSVPLHPWPGKPGKNWILEFKSYEQGRELMQATAIGGACFTEQFPWEVFEEVLRGCRQYMAPGCIWAEFTPIDPVKSAPIEDLYEKWAQGETEKGMYAFYRMSTDEALKAGHVVSSWHSAFFDQISEEMQETRRTGAFASYEGAIYQTFDPKIHVVDLPRTAAGEIQFPVGVWHRRAMDWGASTEHPFYCLWAYKDALGRYWCYDEYWNNSQTCTALDHIEHIKDRHWRDTPYFGNTYGDPSRPDLMRLFGQFGIPVTPANNDVYDGIETVRRHLKVVDGTQQPMVFIDQKRCPQLIRTLRIYRWQKSSGKGVNPQNAKPVPLKRDDDPCDALRYLMHSDCGNHGELPQHLKSERRWQQHGALVGHRGVSGMGKRPVLLVKNGHGNGRSNGVHR